MARRTQHFGGVLYALAAYGSWGLVPLYWNQVAYVPGMEMVAQRTVWAVPLLALWLGLRGRTRNVARVLRTGRSARLLCLTALLLSSNWLVFIWAVTHGHLIDASLGYFLNPLVNVFLGWAVLGESLTRRQGAAVALACLGVAWMGVAMGSVPWIALVLAGTFGAYGLLRKRAGVDALTGLAGEVVILFVPALTFLLLGAQAGRLAFLERGVGGALWVAASGILTVVPLVWFHEAAARLRYSTLGFFQYLAPTGQFLLGLLVYKEAFPPERAVAFVLIWIAVVVYLKDAARAPRIVAGSPLPDDPGTRSAPGWTEPPSGAGSAP